MTGAEWIWYNGDFELYHSIKMHNRREEFDCPVPVLHDPDTYRFEIGKGEVLRDGSDVTICGSGTLNITANGKNGIKSGATTAEEGEASLTIRELTLTINAPVNDAINAEQTLNVESGTLTISAADDAIHSDLVLNIGAEGTDGPTITVTAISASPPLTTVSTPPTPT